MTVRSRPDGEGARQCSAPRHEVVGSLGYSVAALPSILFVLAMFVYPLADLFVRSVSCRRALRTTTSRSSRPRFRGTCCSTRFRVAAITASCQLIGYPVALLVASASARRWRASCCWSSWCCSGRASWSAAMPDALLGRRGIVNATLQDLDDRQSLPLDDPQHRPGWHQHGAHSPPVHDSAGAEVMVRLNPRGRPRCREPRRPAAAGISSRAAALTMPGAIAGFVPAGSLLPLVSTSPLRCLAAGPTSWCRC